MSNQQHDFEKTIIHTGNFGKVKIVYHPRAPKEEVVYQHIIDNIDDMDKELDISKLTDDKFEDSYYTAHLISPNDAYKAFENWDGKGLNRDTALMDLYKKIGEQLAYNETHDVTIIN